MGMLGIGIASLLELFPEVDAFVSLSAQYIPTKYFRKHPQRLKWLMDDYSGWRFMANIKLAGFRYIGINVPEFMRYIQFDIGYYTTGFTKYDYRCGGCSGHSPSTAGNAMYSSAYRSTWRNS
jgi:hypothetical protein